MTVLISRDTKTELLYLSTLYHMFLTFNDPEKKGCENHFAKRRKYWNSASSLSPDNIFCP